MKKSGPDRKYTEEFRRAAVAQVIQGGRSIPQVARSHGDAGRHLGQMGCANAAGKTAEQGSWRQAAASNSCPRSR